MDVGEMRHVEAVFHEAQAADGPFLVNSSMRRKAGSSLSGMWGCSAIGSSSQRTPDPAVAFGGADARRWRLFVMPPQRDHGGACGTSRQRSPSAPKARPWQGQASAGPSGRSWSRKPSGQSRRPVRAAVGQRRRRPARGAEQHDVLAQQAEGQWLVRGQLARGHHRIPEAFQHRLTGDKHGDPPR